MRIRSILVGAILGTACSLAGSVSQAHDPAWSAALAGAVSAVDHLDPAFGDHGVARISNPDRGAGFTALALQPDRMIVVVGQHRDDLMVARYTSAGALDTSFGGTGIVTTTLVSGGPAYATTVALQTDHKIVVGGSASNDFVLVRYKAGGNLDPSFGGTGSVTTTIALRSADAIAALAIQPDGKIIVAGATESTNGSGNGAIVLARYTAGGVLDPSFSGGIVATGLAYDFFSGAALTLQPDGKIVVAGQVGADIGISRFTTTGVPDTSFGGGDGIVTTNLGPNTFAYAAALALQPDGKIVAAGAQLSSFPMSFFALTRYTSDGTLDASFGDAGIVITAINGADNRAYALALQPDGKLVAAGTSSTICSSTCDWRFTLARYRPDGQLDRSFGGVGSITSDFGGRIRALGLQPDGKLLAAGFVTAPPIIGFPPVALLARFVDNAGAIYVPLLRR